MGLIGAVTLCALVAMASASNTPPKDLPREYDINKAPELFATFMSDYQRTYKNEEDKAKHYEAFVESLKKINKQNKLSPSAVFGINKFADYTAEERKQMFGFGVSKTNS